jgi:hypothetical protein
MKPDNIAVVVMVAAVAFFMAYALRTAIRNDARARDASGTRRDGLKSNAPPRHGPLAVRAPVVDTVHAWPYLVRVEYIAMIVTILVLTVWSIVLDAPLEELANPATTPNPSKAPWYFLGLQEMLVYFDAWIAGVVLPLLCIIGLMVIPYVDVNPKGNGYDTLRERKFALVTFHFGFIVLWVGLIIIGIFFRGPGWNFFWPWQYWDPHKVVAITNVNLPYAMGIRDESSALVVGALCCMGWYLPGVLYYLLMKKRSLTLQRMGLIRYAVVAFLFLTMMALPMKMVLRIAFNIKYVWVTPWFNI